MIDVVEERILIIDLQFFLDMFNVLFKDICVGFSGLIFYCVKW